MITLSQLSNASDEDMQLLKRNVDLTTPAYTYDYSCKFPVSCMPQEMTISFFKEDVGYIIQVNQSFTYDGGNTDLRLLSENGSVIYPSWDACVKALRSMSDETTVSHTHQDVNLSSVTDWARINSSPNQNPKSLSFEHLKDELSKVIIGQESAVETIAYQVSKHLAKSNPKRPVSFLAYGPPGVGKSEATKVLADILSKESEHKYEPVWTDLNNFTERHTVYRLTGAPAGYVGYEDEAIFEVVARNPYTIFIFDELDKAHPEVLKTFMAILDEGRLASRKELPDHSREFNFKHCIFFFTSNYNLSAGPTKHRIGFSISEDVSNITCEDNTVDVQYRKKEELPEEPIAKRIYRETEQARKAFVGVGVLREIASRFQCFVEFKALSEQAKVRILAKQVIETGFEYGVRLVSIAPETMQGMINVATSEDSLTVRSFKAIIEGYLAGILSEVTDHNDSYRLEGEIENPVLVPIKSN